mgnify:FL=1
MPEPRPDIYTLGLDKLMQKGTGYFDAPQVLSAVASGLDGSTEDVTTSRLLDGDLQQILFTSKTSFTDTTNGWRQGVDFDGTYKWIIGGSTNSVDWNVTTANTLTVMGAISASTIDIGGADATSFHVDINGNMWLGATTLATAPSSITNAGLLTTTSALIAGWTIDSSSINNSTIYLSSTGFIRSGQTAYDTGVGWYLSADGKFSFGNSAGAKITYDLITLAIAGAFTFDATTGVVSIQQNATTGSSLSVIRNLTATSTDSPVVFFRNQHASDDQYVLSVQQDNTAWASYITNTAGGITSVFDSNSEGIRVRRQDATRYRMSLTAASTGSTITSYDDTGVAYRPLTLDALSYTIRANNADLITISSTGVISILQNNSTSALLIDMGGNGLSIDIPLSANTTQHTIEVSSSALTTGSIARLYSNSADTSARNLLLVINDNALATGATVAKFQQDANGTAVIIDMNGNANALRIDADVTTQEGVNIVLPSLTTADGFFLSSASTDTSARNLCRMYVSSTLATGAKVLNLRQASTADTLFLDNDGTAGYSINIDTEINSGNAFFYALTAGASPASLEFLRNDTVSGNLLTKHGNGYIWMDATGILRNSASTPTTATGGRALNNTHYVIDTAQNLTAHSATDGVISKKSSPNSDNIYSLGNDSTAPVVSRNVKLISGSLCPTYIPARQSIAVAATINGIAEHNGNVYISRNSAGTNILTRYGLDLTSATAMTFTGGIGAAGYNGALASDDSNIYILDTNTTVQKYSISGTVATFVSTITLSNAINSGLAGFHWDGTSFYGVTAASGVIRIFNSSGTQTSTITIPTLASGIIQGLFIDNGVLWAGVFYDSPGVVTTGVHQAMLIPIFL